MRHTMKSIAAALVCLAMVAAPNAPSAATPSPEDPATPFSERGDRGDRAVARLRADADSRLRIHRDRRGVLDFVAGADGTGIDNPEQVRPNAVVASARAHAARYGAAFGIDAGDTLELDRSRPVATGGSVVHFQQHTGDLPVLGGELAVSVDDAGDLASISAETTAEDALPSLPSVAGSAASRVALAATAKAHGLPVGTLTATSAEKWFYDPALLGATDPLGARPVWRFEVGNGVDVRDFLLVDAATGRLALRFEQVHSLNRRVCDNRSVQRAAPLRCTSPVRDEGDVEVVNSDVNDAFDFTGATSAVYAGSGINLSELVGVGSRGSRVLPSTVRWCFTVETCPMRNAFWNGEQMYYGEGFAAAEDVVGHELTHGVIERTSNLFYFHQSGAINESLADIIGEIVDRRHAKPGEAADVWDLGEDVPGGRVRSLSRPGLEGQPDRMRSPLWFVDRQLRDNGGVHVNSGVGNKTAYLISRGGSFNGRSIAGIDAGDPGLQKSAVLWIDVIKRLTSASDYADLGRVLVQSCNELAAAGRAGFAPRHCTSVRHSVAATELGRAPAKAGASAIDAPQSCPRGTVRRVLYRDTVETAAKSWKRTRSLWVRAPARGVPTNATSGTRSWFGLNPDPRFGDPATGRLAMGNTVRVPRGQKTFLHFKHWHLFEFNPARRVFYDGGFVRLKNVTNNRPYADTARLPWVNGPTKAIRLSRPAEPQRGFGGDSMGYGSSRLDVSSYAGKRVGAAFDVRGDGGGSFIGWYVDDVEFYTCAPARTHGPPQRLGQGHRFGSGGAADGPDGARGDLAGHLPQGRRPAASYARNPVGDLRPGHHECPGRLRQEVPAGAHLRLPCGVQRHHRVPRRHVGRDPGPRPLTGPVGVGW